MGTTRGPRVASGGPPEAQSVFDEMVLASRQNPHASGVRSPAPCVPIFVWY